MAEAISARFGRDVISLVAVLLLPLVACLVALNAPSIDLTQHRPSSSEAERVVIFAPFLSPYLTIDAGDRHIAAVASYLRDAVSQGPLGSIYPHAASLPSVITAGRSAIPGDPEQVLSLRPDAVITWAWFSDALVAAGLPVLAMRYESGESPEHNAVAAWAEISRVANRAARGGELIARYDRERELALRYAVRRRDGDPTARRVYLQARWRRHLCRGG